MNDDAQSTNEIIAALQELLVERLHFLLEVLFPELKSDVTFALQSKGKLLSSSVTELPSGVWALLTMLTAQCIAPEIDPFYASSVAVAVECFVCALDLLDDIEDEDQTPVVLSLGSARTLNVATALLTLAQKAILSLMQHDIAPDLIVHLLDVLQSLTLRATSGQHRDLLAEKRLAEDLTQEECIAIARDKAGAIMGLASKLGAICAGAVDEEIEEFSSLGELLGIAHQLDNDAHDLYYLLHTGSVLEETSRSVKTDLLRHKKTLPVVIAAKHVQGLQSRTKAADKENEDYQQALHEGIITTWGMSLLYRERARECLQHIEARRPITPAFRLLLGFD